MSVENLKKGEEFLQENGKQADVVTLSSGLQYQVIQAGKGKQPKAQDRVSVHYQGTLLDGSIFDSSFARREPLEVPVNRVISGWTEALQLMKEGAHWKLFIPASLGYGENGAGEVIPPNSTLIFEVQLLQVK